MVNTYAAQSGGCRFESLWGFGFSLKGAYEVGYSGKKTFLAGLQCTLTSSCAIRKIDYSSKLEPCQDSERAAEFLLTLRCVCCLTALEKVKKQQNYSKSVGIESRLNKRLKM